MSHDKFNNFYKIIKEWMMEKEGINFQKSSNHEISRAFTNFCLNEVFKISLDLDEDQIEFGICDGPNDKGVDFIYQDGRTFHIFQFKYTSQGYKRDSLAGFFDLHKMIFNKQNMDLASEKVRDLLDDISVDDRIIFYFVSNGESTSDTANYFEAEKKQAQIDTKGKDFDWLLYDGRALLEEHSANVHDDDSDVSVKIPIESIKGRKGLAYLDLSEVMGDEEGELTALCIVDGNAIRDIYRSKNNKRRLFNHNIRSYLGANPVNRKMKSTILTEPENFYFFNNGVSALCSSFEVEDDRFLVCSDFQIINGAQTVSEIGKLRGESAENLSKVRVLLKVTRNKQKTVREKIIRFNNSQTVIKTSDFRSNDPIQIHLESKFKDDRLFYKSPQGIKNIVYRRKRGNYKTSRQDAALDIQELSKVLYAYHYDPCQAITYPKMLFEIEGDRPLYFQLFGNKGVEAHAFDEGRFNQTAALVIFWLYIKDRMKLRAKKKNDDKPIENLVFQTKWHFLWAFGRVIEMKYPDEEDQRKIFKRVKKGDVICFDHDNDESLVKDWFDNIFDMTAEILALRSRDQSRAFNFRNWLRTESELEDFKIKLNYSLRFFKDIL